jgi:hypothetical protein
MLYRETIVVCIGYKPNTQIHFEVQHMLKVKAVDLRG